MKKFLFYNLKINKFIEFLFYIAKKEKGIKVFVLYRKNFYSFSSEKHHYAQTGSHASDFLRTPTRLMHVLSLRLIVDLSMQLLQGLHFAALMGFQVVDPLRRYLCRRHCGDIGRFGLDRRLS